MNFLDTSAVFEKYEAIYNEGPKYLTKFLILKTIFYKVDVEISNNPKICRFLPTYQLEKSRQESANFWVIWNFHINLIKNGL